MMRTKPREEDPSINMVLRSGATVGGNEGGKRCDTPMHEHDTELEQGKMESKETQQSFVKVSTRGRRNRMESVVDSSMITTFLETYMKWLRNCNIVQGLQELITRCTGSSELQVIQKIGRHVMCTKR